MADINCSLFYWRKIHKPELTGSCISHLLMFRHDCVIIIYGLYHINRRFFGGCCNIFILIYRIEMDISCGLQSRKIPRTQNWNTRIPVTNQTLGFLKPAFLSLYFIFPWRRPPLYEFATGHYTHAARPFRTICAQSHDISCVSSTILLILIKTQELLLRNEIAKKRGFRCGWTSEKRRSETGRKRPLEERSESETRDRNG